MKRLFLLFGVAVACFWAVCSCRKADVPGHYYDIIPANSKGVCAINVNQLIEKGEITAPMQEQLMGLFRLGKIVKNADESGIDFSEYVFVVVDSIKGNGALVAKIKDAAKLRNIFVCAAQEGMCTPLVTKGKYSETVLSGDVVCRFGSDVLYCTLSHNLEQAREYALRISERKGESMAAEPCFLKMLEGKNDVELFFSMRSLPESMKNNIMMYISHPGIDLNQMSINGSLNFEDSKISLKYTVLAAEPAVMQALLEQGKYMEKVSERFLTYYPASTLLYALYNCQGDKVNKVLEENHFWRNMPMADTVTVQKVIASLDGDMAYGITGLSAAGIPNVLVYAHVKDTYPADLLADVLKGKWGNIGVLKEKGGHRYEFNSEMMDFYFGVKDGKLFYLTNAPEAYRNLGKAEGNPWNKTAMASGIKESYGGLVLNIGELLRTPVVLLMLQQTMGRRQGALLQEALSEFSYMEMLTLAPNRAVWNIYMKDKGWNSLKTLIETGKELTGMK